MSAAFFALLKRDLALALGSGGGAGLGVVFFLCVVTVVPFAVGPDMVLLARIGPAILWIGALLASLIGLERLFASDVEDGSLDALSTGVLPLELVAAAKGLAHWLATGLPLVVAAPVLALMLNLEPRSIGAVVATLLVGALVNFLIGELIRVTGLSGTDRFLGMVFGAARGGLLVVVLAGLLSLAPVEQDLWWRESVLLPHFLLIADWSKNLILGFSGQWFAASLNPPG
jgi:heme exporter protein B